MATKLPNNGLPITCPDCKKAILEVNIERFQNRTYDIDYANQLLISQRGSDWSSNDAAYHCPHCDSLNIDSLMKEFEISGGY